MKKINLILSVLVLLLVLAGCDNNPAEVKEKDPDGVLGGGEIIYPIEVPFEEYSLDGSECKWTNISPKKIVVINSNEELAKYIACTGGGNYPEIDFEKKTLVVVLVHIPMDTANIASRVSKLLLQQLYASKYELCLEIIPSDATVAMPFYKYIAITIEKTEKEITAELNLTILSWE